MGGRLNSFQPNKQKIFVTELNWLWVFFVSVGSLAITWPFGVGAGRFINTTWVPFVSLATSLPICYCDTSWNNTNKMWDATLQPQKVLRRIQVVQAGNSNGTQCWYLYNTQSIFVYRQIQSVCQRHGIQNKTKTATHHYIYINMGWFSLCKCKNKTHKKKPWRSSGYVLKLSSCTNKVIL